MRVSKAAPILCMLQIMNGLSTLFHHIEHNASLRIDPSCCSLLVRAFPFIKVRVKL